MNGMIKPELLLEVKNLNVSFFTGQGELHAVNGISYSVMKGEIMGLVGESGSGKSVEAYTIMGLLPISARINAGSIHFEGRDLLAFTKKEMEAFRGKEISMIFQNPMSYLDPVFTVERQIVETICAHDKTITKSSARALCIEMLQKVSIRDPIKVMKQYPFELSGGMCQRVMIAIALICKPKLLIADEPTTSLDVMIQAQIIQILKELQKQNNMAMIYITHNFGIVAEVCDRVSVIYGGYILERGVTEDIFYSAVHPYTKVLLNAIPYTDAKNEEPFSPSDKTPITPLHLPDGCVYHPNCSYCMDICRTSFPPVTAINANHSACCWLLTNDQTDIDER